MTLTSTVKYEPIIKKIKDISPESVLKMVSNVRREIGELDPSFADGRITTNLDLSSAKDIINIYRNNSEGGCKSCSDFSSDIINNDRDTFFYCEKKEHYQRTPKVCGYNIGFSPELKKYYETPCNSWKPKFSLRLEELIR